MEVDTESTESNGLGDWGESNAQQTVEPEGDSLGAFQAGLPHDLLFDENDLPLMQKFESAMREAGVRNSAVHEAFRWYEKFSE